MTFKERHENGMPREKGRRKNLMAVRLGRRGGRARVAKMTAEERSELGRYASRSRWARAKAQKGPDAHKSAARTHTGGGTEIDPRAAETASLRILYDASFDVLELFFQTPGTISNTHLVTLAEDASARIVLGTQRVIGLTIHRFRARGARFGFPLEGGLSPSTPQAAENIAKALGG